MSLHIPHKLLNDNFLIFSDSTKIKCSLLLKETFEKMEIVSFNSIINVSKNISQINIEITVNALKLSYFHSIMGIKNDVVYGNNERKININGLRITSIEHNLINQTISMEAACDFYQTNVISDAEQIRILREKKLERILKKKN